MDGFVALCRTRLTDAELSALLDWSVLVPFALEEEIVLPVGTAYSGEETVVAGARGCSPWPSGSPTPSNCPWTRYRRARTSH